MAFPCPNCRHQLHLEESACPSCAHAVGYDWRIDAFRHLDPRARECHDAEGSAAAVKPCANVHYGACNWLADETGGGYFELKDTEALGPTFTRVAQELHSQYVLGFEPQQADGKVHTLSVKASRPGLTVRARKSYVAAR